MSDTFGMLPPGWWKGGGRFDDARGETLREIIMDVLLISFNK